MSNDKRLFDKHGIPILSDTPLFLNRLKKRMRSPYRSIEYLIFRSKLLRENKKCKICGDPKDLTVHHLLGVKKDLFHCEVLCQKCHLQIHISERDNENGSIHL